MPFDLLQHRLVLPLEQLIVQVPAADAVPRALLDRIPRFLQLFQVAQLRPVDPRHPGQSPRIDRAGLGPPTQRLHESPRLWQMQPVNGTLLLCNASSLEMKRFDG